MTESEISALKEKARLADIKIGVVDELGITHYSEEDMKLGGERWEAFKKAANPQAILALIEMNEKMREALEFYKGNFDGKEGSYWLDGYKFIQEDKFGDTKHFDNGDRARQTIALFDGEVKA